MNEQLKKLIIGILAAIVVVICIVLVVIGQKNIGYAGLGMEMLGLAGLLVLLGLYNHQYK